VPAAGESASHRDSTRASGTFEGRLEARHLTFTYPAAATPALEDVSFTVEPGRTLAIVGATGAGKSTLVQLLGRLREPEHGMLFLDGIDLRAIPVSELRSALAVVTQEPFLFSETVGGNIAFGTAREWSDDQETRTLVRAAAEEAALAEDIQNFTHTYDTMVGERGITLSGGQKQRVALARALLSNAPVLVVDDALSAVDTATEEAILRSLRRVRQARTCIIVAHRISTVRDADEILFLSNGRVIERGTHESLISVGGAYADMHQRQLLEEELGGLDDAAVEERTH
jgi:ATP-binding cassette subfamily B protein